MISTMIGKTQWLFEDGLGDMNGKLTAWTVVTTHRDGSFMASINSVVQYQRDCPAQGLAFRLEILLRSFPDVELILFHSLGR
jgi:hypothetical protein